MLLGEIGQKTHRNTLWCDSQTPGAIISARRPPEMNDIPSEIIEGNVTARAGQRCFADSVRPLCGIVLAACTIVFSAAAETNSPPDLHRLFDVPSAQMREQFATVQSMPVQVSATHSEAPPAVVLVATVDTESEHFQRIPHIEMLRHDEVPESWPVRSLDSVFRPEEFRVGKTSVSCSITTAIKRRNPLCLLNPIVLNVSW